MGASLLVHTDEESLSEQVRVFDCIIDTVSAPHAIAPIMGTLKVGGAMVLLGAIPTPFELSAFALLLNNHSIEGSLVGGVPETKEMLEFCAKHNIVPDSKVIHAKDASAQFKAMSEGTADAERYVIDISTFKEL
jgi:D-arabinose 1-dehydrogenase-like Zn-dependent alcohol dehydrogenase